MAYLMGIDLGTSSLKTLVTDEAGRIQAQASRDYQFDAPRSGYAEQDPDVWWKACVDTVRDVLRITPASHIKALSFSGQMHGLVTLDKDMRPVRPAILHCDARSVDEISRIRSIFGEDGIHRLMMNPVYTGFLLPSLLWLRENEPANYDRVRHVCLPKDYLKLRLTGELTSDYSDASATLCFDIKGLCWSKEILGALDLPLSLFPNCVETSADTGRVCETAARQTGLDIRTIVVAGGGDQVMQNIGNGTVRPGDATVNIGSSGQVSFQIDRPVLNPSLNTNMFCGYKAGMWVLFGAIMSAGLSLKWWNRLLGKTDYARLDAELSSIAPGSGGIIFLPYMNGERTPHINPNLSGMFIGINLSTTQAHMTQAVMEGVTFALKQCMEICCGLGLSANTLVASGGGARSGIWLQMQADVLNLPIRVSATEEQAGLGAAIAAGTGAGIYGSLEQGCAAAVRYQDRIYLPDRGRNEIYEQYYGLYKQTFLACKDVLQQVTVIGRQAAGARAQ